MNNSKTQRTKFTRSSRKCVGPVRKGVDERRKVKEEEIGGVNLCHCTRALYHAHSSLFLALSLHTKSFTTLLFIQAIASNLTDICRRREISLVFNFNSIYFTVLRWRNNNRHGNVTVLFPACFCKYLFNFKLNLVF